MISIVSTLYKSEAYLDDFIADCLTALDKIKCDEFEFVFVDDGSPDNSVSVLLKKQETNKNIKIIQLSRNFGHHNAIQAGLKNAHGDFVFLIDNDLEVNPLNLIEFHNTMTANPTADVIYGFINTRKGSIIERHLGRIFYKVFNSISEIKIPQNLTTECLMKKRYVQELISLPDKNLFMAGLMHWVGFEQIGIPVTKSIRNGRSTYTITKRFKLMINAISSFTAFPLVVLLYVGAIIFLFSTLFSIFLISNKIINPEKVMPGYTTVVVSVFLSTGMIISSLGIIGIYIEKIFNQVKNRPNFIIKRIYD
jgi:putative glycosyltransferase